MASSLLENSHLEATVCAGIVLDILFIVVLEQVVHAHVQSSGAQHTTAALHEMLKVELRSRHLTAVSGLAAKQCTLDVTSPPCCPEILSSKCN